VLDEPDPDLLAARLLRLLDDPSLLEQQSRAARHRYPSEFTQERADRRLADWLTSVDGFGERR
jgi:glycosyltransferase involved in cell wall biosynthesis